MDATKDTGRPGSERFKMKHGVDELAADSANATGENIGPERKMGPYSEDTVSGSDVAPGGNSTSELKPSLHKTPEKGSRLDESV